MDTDDLLKRFQGDLSFKKINKILLSDGLEALGPLMPGESSFKEAYPKIERVYSKQEIKNIVREHLIPEYRHESVINAVTDFFYRVHMDTE